MISAYSKTGMFKTLWYFLISMLFLSLTACTTYRLPHYKGGVTARDGSPRENIDLSRIPDAEPKVEALSKYGNVKSYVVKGKRYRVLKTAKGYNKVGLASWYGTKFHGKMTSSRERYNLYAMTAASPHLPIPTYVKVTNLENGRTVVVKVNDRGPFKHNRIMDLSYAAAKKLGYAHKGTARIHVTAIDPIQWAKAKGRTPHYPQLALAKPNGLGALHAKNSAQPKLSGNTIRHKNVVHVQVGAFSNRSNAEQLKARLAQWVRRPVKVNRDTRGHLPLYRVQIVSSRKEFVHLQKVLQRYGLMHISVTG